MLSSCSSILRSLARSGKGLPRLLAPLVAFGGVALAVVPAARAVDLSFNFEGAPAEISGQAGDVKQFDVWVTLTTAANAQAVGPLAWSFSATADGGMITAASAAGINVDTIYDDDGNLATPPQPHVNFDLAASAFESTELAHHSGDLRGGAVSAIVLSADKFARTLQAAGTVRVARLSIEAVIPNVETLTTLTLRFENGFQGSGAPVKNKVTIFDGVKTPTLDPTLGTAVITVRPTPRYTFAFEGCPSIVTGNPGEVKTFDVFATLTTANNITDRGAQAWSFGMSASGVTVKAITVEGVLADTIYNSDGNPATPPLPHDSFDLSQSPGSISEDAVSTIGDGAVGAVSAVVLSSSAKDRVLQPRGTTHIARITLEVRIPSGDVAAPASLQFQSGMKGSGQPVKNLVTLGGVTSRADLGSCSFFVGPVPEFVLGFDGCPAEVAGQPGEKRTIDVFATLSTSHNRSSDGVQTWSIGLTAEGATIKDITVDGVVVATVYDDDANPATPPKRPDLFDLAGSPFSNSEPAVHAGDGRPGAVSSVALTASAKKRVLLPNGTAKLAHISLEVTIPAAHTSTPVTLKFEDGLQGSGQPVPNLVFLSLDNQPYLQKFSPLLGTCSFRATSLPTFAYGLEGCPAEVSGSPGEVKTFDVFATLTTGNNSESGGPTAWSLGISTDVGSVDSITVDGLSVSTIYDSDGNPATPPVNPSAFNLSDSAFEQSEPAARPSDGKEGAISAIVLSTSSKTRSLQPEGTVRIAKLTVKATIPAAGASVPLTLRFEDGLKGSGAPVKNLVKLADPINFSPALGSCTVLLTPSTAGKLHVRGDANDDAKVDVSDAVVSLNYQFLGASDVSCKAGLDFDSNSRLEVTDPILILNVLFLGDPNRPPHFQFCESFDAAAGTDCETPSDYHCP